MNRSIDYKKLSKTMAFALRHQPWLYEMELDEEGWVDVEVLLAALRQDRSQWHNLSLDDIQTMLARSDKQRYEIKDGRIRACYGHSKANSIKKMPAIPPHRLLHGTTAATAPRILDEGLKPMSRQFVHLSVDDATARQVARRKGQSVALIEVTARQASQDGIAFYEGNDHVWLADPIPPQYLSRVNFG